MKKKLVFLLGMCFGQCFMWGYGELYTLRRVFSSWLCDPQGWHIAFEKTHDFVERTASNLNYRCFGEDLKAIRAFAECFICVKRFLTTEEFTQNSGPYDSWLKNLCRIAYIVAQENGLKDYQVNGSEFTSSLENSTIEELCNNESFKGYMEEIGGVLTDSIDWESEE